MRYLGEALVLFRRHPRLWTYVAGPLVWTLGLFLAVLVIGYFIFVPPIAHLLTSLGLGDSASSLGTVVYLIVWFFLSGIFYLAALSFLSSLLWDRLSEEVEIAAFGGAPQFRHRKTTTVADSVRRLIFSLALAFVAFFVGFIIPVVGPLLIAGYVATLDVTASAFARRGFLLKAQRKRFFQLKGWPVFLLIAGVFTLLPFVNAILLPILVAAGTLMVARSKAIA
jgi:CysZ protein